MKDQHPLYATSSSPHSFAPMFVNCHQKQCG